MTISEREELIQEVADEVYKRIIKAMEENFKNDEEKKKEEAEKKRLSDEETIKKAMGRK